MPTREPVRSRGRHTAVSAISTALGGAILGVVALVPAMGPALATEAEVVHLEVASGLGGFSPVDGPGQVTATITTPVLVSGRLRVRGADVAVSRPVEVPAGGDQTYRMAVPPLEDGTRLTVELLDGGGDVLVAEPVTVRTPSREVLIVGVVGDPDLADSLGRVRAVVTDRPVTAFTVPADVPAASWDVLDYLIVGPDGAAPVADVFDWVRAGGRAIIDSDHAASLTEDPRPTRVDGVTVAAMGSGRVTVVEQMAGRPAEEWASILRPTPLEFAYSPEFGFGDPRALVTAASEAGTRQVPSLPWLLFAILGFAALVGPVNFFVLSRVGKRDWAWVTIPALSVLAVAGFWIAGRQRIVGTNLTHASVIVDEGSTRVRSAVLVAAGVAGERRLQFEADAVVFPERSLFGSGGTELRLEGEGAGRVELDQLGFTGVGVVTSSAGRDLPRVSMQDGELVVDNVSGLGFWGWGAMGEGGVTISPQELAGGAEGRVSLPAGGGGEFGFNFVDALINQRQLWDDPVRSNSLWSLSQVLATEVDPGSIYFVGLTDDYRPAVTVEGGANDFPGPTIVVIEAGPVGAGEAVEGRAEATVVGAGFVNWVDWGPQRVISTDEMTVEFRLPDPSVTAVLSNDNRFGVPPSGYQVFDWERGGFADFAPDQAIPPSAIAPDGVVYVRLVGANEFGDNPMSPADLHLEWET